MAALASALLAEPAMAAKAFKALTTFTVIACNVAGDAAVIESITKPRAEIHDYQPALRHNLIAYVPQSEEVD